MDMFMNHTYNKFIDKFKFDLEDFATIVVQSYAKVGNIYYIKYLYFQKFHSLEAFNVLIFLFL